MCAVCLSPHTVNPTRARVKLNKGILHSATAHYHSTRGVEYALKSRPLDKVKVKAVVKPGTQLHLESSIRPSFVARCA